MSIGKNILIRLSGSRYAQRFLERMVDVAQQVMGIGSGSDVTTSRESEVFDLVRRRQGPYVIFDVGANQGQYLNLVLNAFPSNDITIHCFEPSAYTFGILRAAIPPNRSHLVHLNNLALGNTVDERMLYSNDYGSGLASLTKRRLDHFNIPFNRSEKVQVTTIDRYCCEKGIDHIDLLKIDVEGHELDVLAGAAEMFRKRAIKIVTFEFGGCNIDTRTFFQDFYYFFQANGMKIFRITASGYLAPISDYRELYEQFRTTNFIAT